MEGEGKGRGRLVWFGLLFGMGNYTVCSVASVHVSYEAKYLAIFVAIRVSVLRDCLSSMEMIS
jgi:hypothetical protein